MANPVVNSTSTIQPINTFATVEPKRPSAFKRVLGGVLGGALNLVAPGLGSVVGGAFGGSDGASMADMQSMMNQQMQNSMRLLAVQNRVQSQSQEFTTFSNLLKSKHDSEMSAVTNFKT